MNYTLNQLRIFSKIVEYKSITKASENLHLTQPAVSIQLKNFQDQFELPLTEVINKRIYITDFGYEIAAAANKILEEVSEIQYKKALYQGKLTGKLKIAVVSTGKYVIPFLLADFLKDNPDIELILDVSNRGTVIQNLEKNEVDFVLMTRLPKELNLETIELIKNKLVFVGPKGSLSLYKKQKNNFFDHLPLIFREKGSATRSAMEDFVEKENLPLDKNITLTSNEAVKQSVISGIGCSIVPLIGIKNELMLGQLEIIPLKGLPIISNWYLVHLRDKKLMPAASAFKEFLNKEIRNLELKYFDWTLTNEK
jgi:DNA-binding transcriptional LysR family regulator